MSNPDKHVDEDEKIWKNDFNFIILYIKIALYEIFQESLFKKKFDLFFRTFLTNRDEKEDGDEKIWEKEFNF